MVKFKPAFVIWGYESENAFRDFAVFLQEQDFEVLTLPDARLNSTEALERVIRLPYILLTSSHFTRDKTILGEIYPDIHIDTSVLELLHHARPLLSVFYPHDLATPLVLNEPLQLCSFDLVLWPTDFFGYQPRPRNMHSVGWVGYREEYKELAVRPYEKVLLFSDLCMHKSSLGIAGTYNKLAPILDCGALIKFPKWPGHEEFEDYFVTRGASVIPADTRAGSVMLNSRVIVSNSLSSISVEASFMGTPVINLVEDYLPRDAQREFLSGLPGCVLSSYGDCERHLSKPPPPPKPRVKRFDQVAVLQIILAALDEKISCNGGAFADTSSHSVELVSYPEPLGARAVPATSPVSMPELPVGPPPTPTSSGSRELPTDNASHHPDPNSDEVRLATAQRLQECGELGSAFHLLQEMVSENTPLPGPYYHIARIAQSQGEHSIAREFLAHAVDRESPPDMAHRILAELLLASGEHEQVLEILSPLLRHNPNDYETLEILRQTVGQMPALKPIPWARLLTDLRGKIK